MMALQVKHLSKSYEGIPILTDINLHLAADERVGLVGANGCGKSTLMKCLAGEQEVDGGTIYWVHPGMRRAYLSQLDSWDLTRPLGEQLHGVPDDLLSRCGITRSMLRRPAGELSGGQKTRAAIARALAGRPEVLLLDEPTNHLDTDALTWLEGALKSFRGAVLVVSHDRYFLDRVVTRIIEVKDGVCREYQGNYTAYASQKRAEREKHEADYRQYLKDKKDLEAAIDRERRWAMSAHTTKMGKDAPKMWKDYVNRQGQAHMRIAKSMEKRLERIKVEKPRDDVKIHIRFDAENSLAKNLVLVERMGFSYDRKTWLYRDASFYVQRGDRVGVVGPNGAGKTTLIKLLLGQLQPTEGRVHISPVKVGYLDQELEGLNPDYTVLQEATGGNGALDQAYVRTLLACMLFSREDVMKPISGLSGGERLRVALVKLLLSQPDILVLDEPTNGLDLMARERVEEALADYQGTLLLISHDRYLLERLGNRVLQVAKGRIEAFAGSYTEFAERKQVAPNRSKQQIKEQCLLLETRLAVLGAQLASPPPEQAEELNAEFIRLSRELRSLRG